MPVDFTNSNSTSICHNNVHFIYKLTNKPKYSTTCRYYHNISGCRYGPICYFSHMDFIQSISTETFANIIQTTNQNQEQKSSMPTTNFQQTPNTIPYQLTPQKTQQNYNNSLQQTIRNNSQDINNIKNKLEEILKEYDDNNKQLKQYINNWDKKFNCIFNHLKLNNVENEEKSSEYNPNTKDNKKQLLEDENDENDYIEATKIQILSPKSPQIQIKKSKKKQKNKSNNINNNKHKNNQNKSKHKRKNKNYNHKNKNKNHKNKHKNNKNNNNQKNNRNKNNINKNQPSTIESNQTKLEKEKLYELFPDWNYHQIDIIHKENNYKFQKTHDLLYDMIKINQKVRPIIESYPKLNYINYMNNNHKEKDYIEIKQLLMQLKSGKLENICMEQTQPHIDEKYYTNDYKTFFDDKMLNKLSIKQLTKYLSINWEINPRHHPHNCIEKKDIIELCINLHNKDYDKIKQIQHGNNINDNEIEHIVDQQNEQQIITELIQFNLNNMNIIMDPTKTSNPMESIQTNEIELYKSFPKIDKNIINNIYKEYNYDIKNTIEMLLIEKSCYIQSHLNNNNNNFINLQLEPEKSKTNSNNKENPYNFTSSDIDDDENDKISDDDYHYLMIMK